MTDLNSNNTSASEKPSVRTRVPMPPSSRDAAKAAAAHGGADLRHHRRGEKRPLFDGPIVRRAIVDSFRKLDPRHQARNPVMFVVEVGSVFTTGLFIQALVGKGEAPAGFILAISLWLWFTVLFANFAEAMAEGRGKAQADTLRKSRKDVHAKKLATPKRDAAQTSSPRRSSARVTSYSSRRATTFPATAKSSKAWHRWTRAPSPAKARRSFARAAAIAAR